MTNERAKSELMQLYGSLSEEKKQALDVLMAQADVTDDDIETMRILFNADIECLCNQGRFNDAKEMEQIRDRLKARLQADGEYKSNKELLCDSCYRKIAGCQAKFHNPHPVDHCIEYKPIEKQADGEYISRQAVLKTLDDMDNVLDEDRTIENYKELLKECYEVLPPVNPQEPKTGHWEWVQYDSNPNIGNWHCSECRTIIPHMPEETDNTPIYKWCPMCGARMVEPQESEVEE